jgi:hypothetical protein
VKFSTQAAIRGVPEFSLSAKPGPFTIEADAEGSLTVSTSRIDARVERVPITMQIPFLGRRGAIQIGAVGPFGVSIQPVELEIRAFGVKCSAVLAKDGMDCRVDGKLTCNLDVDLSGTIPGRVTKAAIELSADSDSDE